MGNINVLSEYYDIFYAGIVLQMINDTWSILLKNDFWQGIDTWHIHNMRFFRFIRNLMYLKNTVESKMTGSDKTNKKCGSSNACGKSLTRIDTYFTNANEKKKRCLIPALCDTTYSYIIPRDVFLEPKLDQLQNFLFCFISNHKFGRREKKGKKILP